MTVFSEKMRPSKQRNKYIEKETAKHTKYKLAKVYSARLTEIELDKFYEVL